MSDWASGPEWDEFVRHTRESTIKGMTGSSFVLSLVPKEGFDVKFALELGAAIMLDKPLLAVVSPGAEMNPKLKRVFDQIVVADIDTEEGRERVAEAIARLQERL